MFTRSSFRSDAPPDRPLTVAVSQPRCHPGDIAANVNEHAVAVGRARADVVVFPELSLTGYVLAGPDVDLDDPILDGLLAVCRSTGSVALVGAPTADATSDRRFIATLMVTAESVTVAYRKMYLGSDEHDHFRPGSDPELIDVRGWRTAPLICKDTGTQECIDGLQRLTPSLVVAGLVHTPSELEEQDRRGAAIARRFGAPVAFASAAGDMGPLYRSTAGHSTIWSADGSMLARASGAPGDLVRATVSPTRS